VDCASAPPGLPHAPAIITVPFGSIDPADAAGSDGAARDLFADHAKSVVLALIAGSMGSKCRHGPMG
jgi:hypothetical protein